MRGEKDWDKPFSNGLMGSPPRARGKVWEDTTFDLSTRITPACAGKREDVFLFPTWFKDHPRVRGEKDWDKPFSNGLMGSPPRARGKDGLVDQRLRLGGITPACAGKRSSR